jgi:hypothetical protein
MTATLVKPGRCRRCKGKGDGTWRPQGGFCYGCGGTGLVETDPATIAAAKARQEAASALASAASGHSVWASMGLTNLACAEPERYDRAIESFAAGRTDVLDALAAYGRAPLEEARRERAERSA